MSTKRGSVLVVVGAQYGSEGKGVIVHHLADGFNYHLRVGGSNAGHTFMHKGNTYAMQVIPCGWTNPNARLMIGAGGLLDLPVLVREMAMVYEADSTIPYRLFIDPKCGIIAGWHRDEEGGVTGALHERIGSTGKGVGVARRDRVMRDPEKFKTVATYIKDLGDPEILKTPSRTWVLSDFLQPDVSALLNGEIDKGANVLIEGTQGAGLSLIHGDFPYVTSADTNAAQMMADVGLSPLLCTNVLLVARTYPIRVAGNSGKLEKELSWLDLSREIGRPVEERTTVTKKVRRVGRWDETLMRYAMNLNRPTSVALTFLDYVSPEDEGVTDWEAISPKGKAFVRYVESAFDTSVSLVGTGGEGFKVVDRGMGV